MSVHVNPLHQNSRYVELDEVEAPTDYVATTHFTDVHRPERDNSYIDYYSKYRATSSFWKGKRGISIISTTGAGIGVLAACVCFCLCCLIFISLILVVSLPVFAKYQIDGAVGAAEVDIQDLAIQTSSSDEMTSKFSATIANPTPFSVSFSSNTFEVYDDQSNLLGDVSAGDFILQGNTETTIDQVITFTLKSRDNMQVFTRQFCSASRVEVLLSGQSSVSIFGGLFSLQVEYNKTVSINGMDNNLNGAVISDLSLTAPSRASSTLSAAVSLTVVNPSVISGSLSPMILQISNKNHQVIGKAYTSSQTIGKGSTSIEATLRLFDNSYSRQVVGDYLSGKSSILTYTVLAPGDEEPQSYLSVISIALERNTFALTATATGAVTLDAKTVQVASLCSYPVCYTMTLNASIIVSNPTQAHGPTGNLVLDVLYDGDVIGNVTMAEGITLVKGTSSIFLSNIAFHSAGKPTVKTETLVNSLINGDGVSSQVQGKQGAGWGSLLTLWSSEIALSGFAFEIGYDSFLLDTTTTHTIPATVKMKITNPLGISIATTGGDFALSINGTEMGNVSVVNATGGNSNLILTAGTHYYQIPATLRRTAVNTALFRGFISNFAGGNTQNILGNGTTGTNILRILRANDKLQMQVTAAVTGNNGKLITAATVTAISVNPLTLTVTGTVKTVVHNPTNKAINVTKLSHKLYYRDGGLQFLSSYNQAVNLNIAAYGDQTQSVATTLNPINALRVGLLYAGGNLYVDALEGVATVALGEFSSPIDYTVLNQKVE